MAGTKPIALHTEYAKEGAQFDGGFYGPGNDVVFYLVRADQGGGGEGMESGELPTSEGQWVSGFNGSGFDYDPSNLDPKDLEMIDQIDGDFEGVDEYGYSRDHYDTSEIDAIEA